MASIAIIDDDESGREVLQMLLAAEGHTVQQFISGKDFLATFKLGLFGLILMDLEMPDMDGYELLAIVRREDPSVPVVTVTAHAYNVDREKARAAGFSDFVTKPFTDFPTFLGIINKHLHHGDGS
jgi:CheY-like chemotaxis protein